MTAELDVRATGGVVSLQEGQRLRLSAPRPAMRVTTGTCHSCPSVRVQVVRITLPATGRRIDLCRDCAEWVTRLCPVEGLERWDG